MSEKKRIKGRRGDKAGTRQAQPIVHLGGYTSNVLTGVTWCTAGNVGVQSSNIQRSTYNTSTAFRLYCSLFVPTVFGFFFSIEFDHEQCASFLLLSGPCILVSFPPAHWPSSIGRSSMRLRIRFSTSCQTARGKGGRHMHVPFSWSSVGLRLGHSVKTTIVRSVYIIPDVYTLVHHPKPRFLLFLFQNRVCRVSFLSAPAPTCQWQAIIVQPNRESRS
jgi:hypothetical protein